MATRSLPFLFVCGFAGFVSAQQVELVEWRTRQLNARFYSEGATVGDFNRDGEPDVASGPFWYAGPTFTESHAFYAQDAIDPHGYSNNFFAFTDDFNNDGWDDILVYGFPGKDASWFENPQGVERFWPRHRVLDAVENESPAYIDLNGDGRRDVVCSSGGYFGFAEIDAAAPELPWTFRRISDNSAGGRFTHGMGVGDVNQDGRLDLLEKNGWWEQPESLAGDPVWKKHPFAFGAGHGPAQMFAYDVDGDDDNDVVCSLNAHGFGLAWYEQLAADDGGISFERHGIMGAKPNENAYGVAFSQLHAVELVDIDGDGLKDILTGKRYWAHGPQGDAQPSDPAVLYWFRLERSAAGVRFVPHLIDDDSGVGTEVDYADLNKDGMVDVIVGNKKGTFVHLQERRGVPSSVGERFEVRARDLAARASNLGLPQHAGLQPREAAAAITVPQGFHVQLAAGEPLVHQPIAMAFDHRGRLWVAEAHTYPIRANEGEGEDKIIILEDHDADGVFESRKVFIDGLNLVSGLEVGFGGVWVGAAPYLMWIPDRNSDDEPDGPPEILLDGFGYQDTHETLNAFTWGPDGWLYGCHGVFTHSKVGRPGTPDAQRTPLNAGVWRYHPLRHEFEVFAHGTSNPWGIDFNDYGQAFITACVIPHLYHVIQGARYQRQGGQHFHPYVFDDIKTIADHAHYAGNIRDHAWWGRNHNVDHADTNAAGGGHAHCGAMIYLGDNWPRQYRNSIFMTNLLGNRINNDVLRRVGSGYVASHGDDFLFANYLCFRCINQKYSSDGSVYMIDWYDKNACHRRDKELWDRTNGRVYRVRFGNPEVRQVDLQQLTNAELIALQFHENDWYVRTARRILQERCQTDNSRRAAVRAAFEAADGPEFHSNVKPVPQRLRMAWALHACNFLSDARIAQLLAAEGHRSEYLRAWAIQLDVEDGKPQNLSTLKQLAQSDPSPLVRLYLASALQRLPLEDRWQIAAGLLRHAQDEGDHNLPLLIWYGTEPLVAHHVQRAFGLAAESRIPIVSRYIYRRAAADPETRNDLLVTLGAVPNEDTQKLILDELTAALRSQGRLAMPAQWPSVYTKLAASSDPWIRERAQWITVKFGDASIFPTLRRIATDKAARLESRRSALQALLAGKDAQLTPVLLELLRDKDMRGAALRGLAGYADESIPAAILDVYTSLDVEEKSYAVTSMAERAAFAHPLRDAVENKSVPRADLSAFVVRQIASLQDPELVAKVNRVWGTLRSTPQDKQEKIHEWQQRLGPAELAAADLPHGRVIYEKTCGKCHRLFGQGGQIGPDITGSNRANLDYLLQNLIDPNALIGRDYQATQLVTADGRLITGLVMEENDTAIAVQTANEKLVVDKRDIEVRRLSPTSMMPEGQIDQLQFEEVRDLVAYLASPLQVPLPGEGPVWDPKTGRVHGAQEAEQLAVVSTSGGNARPQAMNHFKAGRWSGNSQLWWTGAKPGDTLVLTLAAPEAGSYELFVALTKARDYGIVAFSVNGSKVDQAFDLFHSPEVVSTGVLSLGVHSLKAGKNELTVVITGTNPEAEKAYMFGLDYVYLRKVSDTPQDAS